MAHEASKMVEGHPPENSKAIQHIAFRRVLHQRGEKGGVAIVFSRSSGEDKGLLMLLFQLLEGRDDNAMVFMDPELVRKQKVGTVEAIQSLELGQRDRVVEWQWTSNKAQ